MSEQNLNTRYQVCRLQIHQSSNVILEDLYLNL